MRNLILACGLILALPGLALAGDHTNLNWSSAPDGDGSVCDLNRFNVCYYNFTSATDSPVLSGASRCSQTFTRVIEVTADIQVDIQACDTAGDRACSDLPQGSNITASGIGPEGGVASGIKVVVDTCTTCEGEVEAVCGRGR